jgi:hypothetical protein
VVNPVPPSLVLGAFGVLLVPMEPDDLPEYLETQYDKLLKYLETHQDQHQCYDVDIHTPLRGVYGPGY